MALPNEALLPGWFSAALQTSRKARCWAPKEQAKCGALLQGVR
tara:strand:+ start:7951 stop:8079 length:129 start_codon:yes stop_codon:yes gene_type:complete